MDILDTRALQGEAETGAWPAGENGLAGHEVGAELGEEFEGEGEFQLQDGQEYEYEWEREDEYESEWEQQDEPGQREEFESEDEQEHAAAMGAPAEAERYGEDEDEDYEPGLGLAGYETGYEGELEGPPTVPAPTGGGRLVVQHLPLLRQHAGTAPD